MVASIRPYSLAISPKGDVAVLTNQGGGQGGNDMISVIDLKQNPPRIVDNITVGQIPEGATMSPDGMRGDHHQNGSARVKGSRGYNDHGLVKVFLIQGTKLTLAAEAKVGAWGQGVVWSRAAGRCSRNPCSTRRLMCSASSGRQLKVVAASRSTAVRPHRHRRTLNNANQGIQFVNRLLRARATP